MKLSPQLRAAAKELYEVGKEFRYRPGHLKIWAGIDVRHLLALGELLKRKKPARKG